MSSFDAASDQIYRLVESLYPICRSITAKASETPWD